MKVGDYHFTAYKMKSREAVERQIDRVFETNKDLILTRANEKYRDAVNVSEKQIYNSFKQQVLRRTGKLMGGNNDNDRMKSVNEAIAEVLRSGLLQTKEMIYKTNVLSKFDGSLAFKSLQTLEPGLTISEVLNEARYTKPTTSAADYGLETESETSGFIFTSPRTGRTYKITPPDSQTGKGWEIIRIN